MCLGVMFTTSGMLTKQMLVQSHRRQICRFRKPLTVHVVYGKPTSVERYLDRLNFGRVGKESTLPSLSPTAYVNLKHRITWP